eukprot:1048998_1
MQQNSFVIAIISGLKLHSSYDAPSGNNNGTSFMDINAETDLVCCDLKQYGDESKQEHIRSESYKVVRRFNEAVDGEPCMGGYIAATEYPREGNVMHFITYKSLET